MAASPNHCSRAKKKSQVRPHVFRILGKPPGRVYRICKGTFLGTPNMEPKNIVGK